MMAGAAGRKNRATTKRGAAGKRAQRLPILMYHSLSEQASQAFLRFAVPPPAFGAHLRYLATAGYETRTVTQVVTLIASGRPIPSNVIVITFDDGFADFFEAALPELQVHGFTATVYVTAGYIGATANWLAAEGEGGRRMLDWTQLREMRDAGIEIGSHSVRHPHLDMVGGRRAWRELVDSRVLLEDGLGCQVTSFAYPYGHHTRRTQRLARAAGYLSACGVKRAMGSTHLDALGLPRLEVKRSTSSLDLAKLLARRFSRAALAYDGARAVVSRAARRALVASDTIRGVHDRS